MTLPGAETMKGGIMGEDCFLCSAGAPFAAGVAVAVAAEGSLEANCAGIVSMGECSGVWVACDDVVRGARLATIQEVSHDSASIVSMGPMLSHLARRASSCVCCRLPPCPNRVEGARDRRGEFAPCSVSSGGDGLERVVNVGRGHNT